MSHPDDGGQLPTLPSGGGALQGLGEKFSPDLHTGTANFTVPISLPRGRNGFQPELSLTYSTGSGNGPFGLGWSVSVPGVSRKTSTRVPRYQDRARDLKNRDTFVLSGAEDLIPVESAGPSTRYQPRTEGLFAEIRHIRADQQADDYWNVTGKDGLTSLFGTPGSAGQDPATIGDPDSPRRVFAWKLARTEDPFGNLTAYEYDRERGEVGPRRWDQLYLSRICYVDDVAPGITSTGFLVSVSFEYEDRPDPFSDFRAGFEVRTTRRCKAITVRTHAGQERRVRRYELDYRNDDANAISLLERITIVGFGDTGDIERLPPLELGYSAFTTKAARLIPVTGEALPSVSLADPSFELVDVFGNGLPDIVELDGTPRFWRNLGEGRFDLPRGLAEAPAGLGLAESGVQLVDADGDGRADLLVTTATDAGYFPMRFGAAWARRSRVPYRSPPTFSLEDPAVRLVDLDGDGVVDVLRAGARFECFFNDRDPQVAWKRNVQVGRQALESFPNVDFSDARVRIADMSGDGLQDIVLLSDENVDFWPNRGHGRWGPRIRMGNTPDLPWGYHERRILLGDVDGDGAADLVYVGDNQVTLWLNRGGTSWSDPFSITGTPSVTDDTSLRLTDLLGCGVAGVLWSHDADGIRPHMHFLDFTGGTKPYLLEAMDNNMGAETRISYRPSTHFFLQDQMDRATRWRTPLPFPVQVVTSVDVEDAFSHGRFTTRYRYSHGYWDGEEREFRGFGLVEQRDSESVDLPRVSLHGVPARHVSLPVYIKTWFHQGPVGDEAGDWREVDYSSEYWSADPQLLEHTAGVNAALSAYASGRDQLVTAQDRRLRRDALRALRASVLRTELYASDGSRYEDRPYTVTEYAYGVREESPPPLGSDRPRAFFPHVLAERTTHWERGDDPATTFNFAADYDGHGQARQESSIAMPRRLRKRRAIQGAVIGAVQPDETRMLTKHSLTHYATPIPGGARAYDRVWQVHTFELDPPVVPTERQPDNLRAVLVEQRDIARQAHQQQVAALRDWRPGTALPASLRLIGHTINHYDGPAFVGRTDDKLEFGALTRGEALFFSEKLLDDAYKDGTEDRRPAYLGGTAAVPSGAPAAFGRDLGYRRCSLGVGGPYQDGYYADVSRKRYDFQSHAPPPLGLPGWPRCGTVVATQDALLHETTLDVDRYWLFVVGTTNPAGLTTSAAHDYRTFQPAMVTDVNANPVFMTYTPIGLPAQSWATSESGDEGGTREKPDVAFSYDLSAYVRTRASATPLPISVVTTRRVWHASDRPAEGDRLLQVSYSDGFGRIIQTRAQADDLAFGQSGDDVGLPVDPGLPLSPAIGKRLAERVRVSGWQVFDNKGRVVAMHEPFLSQGLKYQAEQEAGRGHSVETFYDPRGRVLGTLNPDGSRSRVIYGRPRDLDALGLSASDEPAIPEGFEPNCWETYIYDANDLAPVSESPAGSSGGIRPLTDRAPPTHHFTPASTLEDGLGRVICRVERNNGSAGMECYLTRATFDVRGNQLSLVDALDRAAFQYRYDLANRPLRVASIDGGVRTQVINAFGLLVEYRDSRGAVSLREYDPLNRFTRLWARNERAGGLTLRERVQYGDRGVRPAGAGEEADRVTMRRLNMLGQPSAHWDEAGVEEFREYDFKGNPVARTRQVISDATLSSVAPGTDWLADWARADSAGVLDSTVYETTTTVDALNRPVEVTYPMDSEGKRRVLRPTYNRAGELESVALFESATASSGDLYISRIAYNAKGQRVLVAYGDSMVTRHAYDPTTFRLARLRTERLASPGAADRWQGTGQPLQDSLYAYDLAGNIASVEERVPNCGLGTPGDKRDRLRRTFTYDAVYRLASATGRACVDDPEARRRLDSPNCGFPASGAGGATASNAPDLAEPYIEMFEYDPAGNLLELAYVRPRVSGQRAWKRSFGMGKLRPHEWRTAPNNQATELAVGQTTLRYRFDENGCIASQNGARSYAWDHADRLISHRVAAGTTPTLEARYLSGADGQRVKKWVRKNGKIESSVYVDGVFEHHRSTDIPGRHENNTLHVVDDRARLAAVRIGRAHRDDRSPPAHYCLTDHLGSVAVVASPDGSWMSREEYSPYGETTFGGFARKRYRYAGKERDEESGLIHFGSRSYAPHLARWTSVDPVGPVEATAPNAYAYCRGRPLVNVDASGTADAAAAAMVGLAPVGGAVRGLTALQRAQQIWGAAQMITSPKPLGYVPRSPGVGWVALGRLTVIGSPILVSGAILFLEVEGAQQAQLRMRQYSLELTRRQQLKSAAYHLWERGVISAEAEQLGRQGGMGLPALLEVVRAAARPSQDHHGWTIYGAFGAAFGKQLEAVCGLAMKEIDPINVEPLQGHKGNHSPIYHWYADDFFQEAMDDILSSTGNGQEFTSLTPDEQHERQNACFGLLQFWRRKLQETVEAFRKQGIDIETREGWAKIADIMNKVIGGKLPTVK